MWSSIADIFTGGALKSVENVAKEWIETDKEKAEAKSLFIKTLDPNGLMRRDISRKVSTAYQVYLFTTMALVLSLSFGLGDAKQLKFAIDSLTNLFVPITAMFTGIVSVSFGVNLSNTMKGK